MDIFINSNKCNMVTKSDIQELKSELIEIKETVSVITNDQKNDVIQLLRRSMKTSWKSKVESVI